MDGEDAAEDSVRVYDNEQILGIASGAMSKTTGGTEVQDFVFSHHRQTAMAFTCSERRFSPK